MKRFLISLIVGFLCTFAIAQESTPPASTQQEETPSTQPEVTPMEHTPVFHVTVVSRNISAVNYQHHNGSTELDFRGTDLMPQAKGKAKVESRTGRMQIDAEFEDLRKPTTFGPEFLTYVLWAVTPEGRPVNLGEVTPNDDGKAKLTVSSDLQAFGLVVTAEPYFAVTRPSNEVVLENVVTNKTKGWEVPITAKYELLDRGSYTVNVTPDQLPSITADPKTPIDLLEAMNAVAMAKAAGAQQYAAGPLQKAEDFLARAQDYFHRKQSDKAIATVARGAVESAEDARVLTWRRKQQEEAEAERRATEERAAQAQQQAQEAQTAAQQAQAQAEAEAQQRAQAEQQQQQAEQERQAAEQAKAQAEQAQQQAEQARQQALAQQQAAQQQAQQAQLAAQRAEQEKEQTRQQLMQQLNQVLQTRETARGLIVSMPDVLFDTAKYSLKPGARERLAKVAGILIAHPDLKVQVEGHTDNVGGVEYNQQLSEQRANAVRDFLVSQGVSPNSISSQGFGMSEPVASNDNAAGRQLNRRVDLVVSGESIGQNQVPNNGSPAAASPASTVPRQPAALPATQPQPAPVGAPTQPPPH